MVMRIPINMDEVVLCKDCNEEVAVSKGRCEDCATEELMYIAECQNDADRDYRLMHQDD